MDREKVIKDLEFCVNGHYKVELSLATKILALLKEQDKLVNVDKLREKLGFAESCEKCKQNSRACQYDSHFSLMDFCERFDMAIEELMQEGR